jgi:peptidoglycan/LPS O-acetylase OafA/YrhL
MHDGYRPEIDGLRAVAVLGVVAYHAGLARVTGGFVGVDVFFVISGYLITSLILREGDAGRFSLRAFWGRRIRRLAPAMILMLAGSAILAHLLLYPLEFKAFARALIAQPFLLANVLFYLQDPYFAPASATMPLLHTWSLAVEEQFYLVYPLTLLLLIRAGDRGRIGWITGAFLATAALGIALAVIDRHAAFYLLPARAWEFLAGALVAVTLPAGRRRCPSGSVAALTAWAGLAAILVPMIVYREGMIFPGTAALPPVLGAAAVLIAGTAARPPLAIRLLSTRPMVWLGLVSYGFYLWHWPLLVFQNQLLVDPLGIRPTPDAPVLERIVAVLVALFLAWASYRYVELPIRRRHLLARRRTLVAAMAMAVCAMIGYGVAGEAGWLRRFPAAEDRYLVQETAPTNRCGHWLNGLIGGDFCRIADGRPEGGGVLLMGDSHAGMMARVLADVVRRHGLSLDVTRLKCPAIGFGGQLPCAPGDRVLADEIRRRDIRLVVLVGRWDRIVEGTEPGGVDAALGLGPLPEDERIRRAKLLETALTETIDRLRQLGVQVAVMKQVPLMPFLPPRYLASRVREGQPVAEAGRSLASQRAFNRHVDAAIDHAAQGRAAVLDPGPLLCDPDGFCRAADPIAGTSRYRDEDHLSPVGSALLIPLFEHLLTDLADRKG